MSAPESQSLWDLQIIPGVTLWQITWIAVGAIAALILERVITRYVREFAKRARLERSVQNNLVLTFRTLILVGAAAFVVRVAGLSPEWFLTFSALGGAAVGFASSQTIGNFVAGLYLLATRPFKVGDYVRIGTVEGIVQEITINYTKILTIGNNVVSIINLLVLQREVTNYLYESEAKGNLYCYTFEIGFDHSVPTGKVAEIFSSVLERHRTSMVKEASFMLSRSDAFGRVYVVYLYVKKPEDVFTLRPQIAEEVFSRWDAEKKKETE